MRRLELVVDAGIFSFRLLFRVVAGMKVGAVGERVNGSDAEWGGFR